ncbi:hypothetical protein G9464_04440 [Halostella sp. JP-L12]|uniref:hypothetical protein n=1 Tax=Halostella TaxID=1843185 RepID=UPI000EF820A3|nr:MULTISPECIES: hypothetical protein [Halostella]NHN46844.1 hypothetical protein [Halostella sp. JP-L12]
MTAKPTAARRDRSSTVRTPAPTGSLADLVRAAKRTVAGLLAAAFAALVVTGAVAFLTSFEGAYAFALVAAVALAFGTAWALPFLVVRAVTAALVRLDG